MKIYKELKVKLKELFLIRLLLHRLFSNENVLCRLFLAVDLSVSRSYHISLHTQTSMNLHLSLSIPSRDFPLTPRPPVVCRSHSQLPPITTVHTYCTHLTLEVGISYNESLSVCEIIGLRTHVNTQTLCKPLCYFSSLIQFAAEQFIPLVCHSAMCRCCLPQHFTNVCFKFDSNGSCHLYC